MNTKTTETEPVASATDIDNLIQIRVDDDANLDFWMEFLVDTENNTVLSHNGRHIYPHRLDNGFISVAMTGEVDDLTMSVRDALHQAFELDISLTGTDVTFLRLVHPIL